jgi:hypothetical protein
VSQPVSATVEAALIEHFGSRPTRASVSFVGVDPLEVLRFEPIPGERAYVTLGMSRHPMTGADSSVLVIDGPRAELMLHLRDPADELADVWRSLAVLAAAPQVEGVVYAPDMSVDLGQSLGPRASVTGGVVTESPLAPIDSPDGTVDVLQLLPATPTELAWCRVRGAAALRERWRDQAVDLLDLRRHAVGLD